MRPLPSAKGTERTDALELLHRPELSSTECTAPNVTPAAFRIVRHSGQVPLGEHRIQNLNQGGGILLTTRRIGRQSARSSASCVQPMAVRKPRSCRCSLKSAMMNQRPSRQR